MTIKAIAKEIEKRILQLEEQYVEMPQKIAHAKLYGTDKEFDELVSKRWKISNELSKLRTMLKESGYCPW